MQKVWLYILFFVAVFMGGQFSCTLLSPSPSSLPDYDNSKGFILDYAVGDRFEILKPMFLLNLGGGELHLSMPGLGSPSLEQYAKDPKQFSDVAKLIPAGTQIHIIAIKGGGQYTSSITYVHMEGITEWVGVSISEYIKVGQNYHFRYNREYFKKFDIP